MEDDFDFLPFEPNNESNLVQKFEEMRAMGATYYFDVEEFEELIDHYLFEADNTLVHEILSIAKGQHPDSTSLTLKEAETLVYSEDPAKAIKLVEGIELFDHSNPEHFFSKASIYSMADKKEKAIEILSRLVEISEEEDLLEAKMALAKEFQEMGEYERSIKQYLEILKDNSTNEDALMELTVTCELSGQYEYGIKLIEDFIDENPYSFFAWFSLGNMHLNQDDHDKAIEAFEYAIVIKDKFYEAHFNLASTLMKIERYEEAIESFKNSLTEDTPDPITYNFIGHCYIVIKDNEKAIIYFNKAVETTPNYSDGWLGFAVAYANMEKYDEALYYIEKAVKLNPDNPYYHYFYGDLLFNMGDYEKAEEIYGKVYGTEGANARLFIDYAEVLAVNQKSQKAIDVLVEGITQYPDDVSLYYRYAALMLELGHLNDAESILILALEIDPKESDQLFEHYPNASNYASIIDLIENYK